MELSKLTSVWEAKDTVYFIRDGDGLRQGLDLNLRNEGKPFRGRLSTHWGLKEDQQVIEVPAGESTLRVYVPDIREPEELELRLICPDGCVDFHFEHKPQRHWTVHLIQFAHHDLGYTDLPSNVLREYCGFYDDVLRFCTETDHFPEESRFRYTIEQGWSLLYYLEHRPPEVVEEMMRRIREGRIEVNAFVGNEVTELLGPEEMARMLYPVFELKRKYGIPITSAEHNDIPGISWGVAAAMAASGIRWFAPALPDYFRWGESYHTFWDEDKIAPKGIPATFFWEAPDGEKTLFWYGRQGAGGQVDVTLRDLPSELERMQEAGYPYDVHRYLVMGGWRDNSLPRVEFAYTCKEWNEKWAYPRLVQSLNSRFFPELEKQLSPKTPVYRGELPATDYSVCSTSTAYPSSLNRVAHDWLLSGERIAALASEITPYRYPAETIAEAYYCALMNDEHAWGLAHPTGPGHEACIAQHCEFAYRAAALAHDVLTKAINAIADHISRDEDGCYAVIFNPLDRPRTGLAIAEASQMEPCARPMSLTKLGDTDWDGRPLPYAAHPVTNRAMFRIPMQLIKNGLEVVDLSTGAVVPHEIYEVASPQAPVPYASYRYAMAHHNPDDKFEVRFIASDVPALGYKLYRFLPSPPRRGGGGEVDATLPSPSRRGAGGEVASVAERSGAAEAGPAGAETPSPLAGEGRGEGGPSPSPLAGEGRGEGGPSPSPLAGEGWGEGGTHRVVASVHPPYLESRFYRVELDPNSGAIAGIFDKDLKRELLDKTCEHKANQLVLRSSITSKTFTSGKATIEQGRCGDVSASLIVKTTAEGYPQVTQEIILYSDLKRIDIANRLLKDSTPQIETFLAFPWAFEKPKFVYEGSLSVIEPLVDQFPGSNSEYCAIQHWADVSDGKAGVTMTSIDAPMMQFGGNWPLYVSQAHHGFTPPNFDHPFHTKKDVKKGWMYSLALVNNFRTNFSPTQNGDLLFRYSITSHSGDWKKGMARDFGYGVSLPFVYTGLMGEHEGELGASAGFCEIDQRNVLLVTLKRAEDGRGFIIRLLETEGKDSRVTVMLPFLTISEAFETNLVEEDQRLASCTRKSVTVDVKAWSTATVRAIPA